MLLSFDLFVKVKVNVFIVGLNVFFGVVVGKFVFIVEDVKVCVENGEDVLFICKEISLEDIDGMWVVKGILISIGGKMSYVVVVVVGWGKCCIVGVNEVEIDVKVKKICVNGKFYGEKDMFFLDGVIGEVMFGEIVIVEFLLSGDFGKVMKWLNKYCCFKVCINVDFFIDL